MIVWVKYGFESTPLKMYNTNVSSAILLSFLRATCIKDVDEFCKQKNIQLSIELDAIRRAMLSRKSNLGSTAALTPEAAHAHTTASTTGSRPPSANDGTGGVQRPTTPSTPGAVRRGSNAGSEHLSEEDAAARSKKAQLEKQLETINAAAKLVKELIAGVSWVDLVDTTGARMNLDSAGNARVNTLLTARQEYSVVVVTKTEYGDIKVTPLVFKLAS